MRGVRRMLAGVVVVVAFVVLSGDGDGTPERSNPLPRDALRLGSRTIAFVCARRICVWEGSARAPRPLTERRGLGDASPVWSPDGSRTRVIAAVLGDALRVIDPETGRVRGKATELLRAPTSLLTAPRSSAP